jgi:hypothetical protein
MTSTIESRIPTEQLTIVEVGNFQLAIDSQEILGRIVVMSQGCNVASTVNLVYIRKAQRCISCVYNELLRRNNSSIQASNHSAKAATVGEFVNDGTTAKTVGVNYVW